MKASSVCNLQNTEIVFENLSAKIVQKYEISAVTEGDRKTEHCLTLIDHFRTNSNDDIEISKKLNLRKKSWIKIVQAL